MHPDFLCIGAQKAGTTWLHRNLGLHPDVWLPPVKEIQYFDRASGLPLILQACHPRESGMRDWVWRGLRRRLTPNAGHAAPTYGRNVEIPARMGEEQMQDGWQAAWYLRLMLLPRGDKWYTSLFAPAGNRLTGDVTPYYANLPPERIACIHTLLPEARIIYLLRDPIDRLWSQAGMEQVRRNPAKTELPERIVLALLDKDLSAGLSDYAGNLERWSSCYPVDQILVGFYDQLAEDPVGLLQDVHRFLGLKTNMDLVPAGVRERHNAGRDSSVPDRLARIMARAFHDQVCRLDRQLGSPYTARWLARIEGLLNG